MNYAKLKDRLKKAEGFRGHAYDDKTGERIKATGAVTIGYGRNLDANPISEFEAEIMLDKDIGRAVEQCKQLPFFAGLDEVRSRAVVEMVFNLGIEGFKTFKNTIAAIDAKAWPLASHEMRESKWARQVGERAQELADMMLTGEDIP